MKYLRLILGIVLGIIVITFVAELIEFFLVKMVSGKSFDYLQENQIEYFNIRNRKGILILKMFYSFLAGFLAGYILTFITKELAKTSIYILIFIQIISLIWAGFLSELSSTGPLWMWIYLIIIIPTAILIGYKWYIHKEIRMKGK